MTTSNLHLFSTCSRYLAVSKNNDLIVFNKKLEYDPLNLEKMKNLKL